MIKIIYAAVTFFAMRYPRTTKNMACLTLGELASPILVVNNVKGKRFDHPLGEHYKELKTVLTTKELSYLINFPLRSVPGISVVDSCPEFNLNPQSSAEFEQSFAFGKLLYGGSETKIQYFRSFRIYGYS